MIGWADLEVEVSEEVHSHQAVDVFVPEWKHGQRKELIGILRADLCPRQRLGRDRRELFGGVHATILPLERSLSSFLPEVLLATRRYEAVDPNHRLVASELEARWNAALQKLRACEARLASDDYRMKHRSRSHRLQRCERGLTYRTAVS